MSLDKVTVHGLADNAVTSDKIGVDVIAAEDIAANAISVAEIQDGAVTHAKLHTDMDLTGKTVALPTLSNLTASSIAATVSIENNDGDNVTFLKDIPIPTGSAVEVMSGNKVVLETSDVLKVQSSVANSLDTVLSIMEIT